jgi:hypothetical protein
VLGVICCLTFWLLQITGHRNLHAVGTLRAWSSASMNVVLGGAEAAVVLRVPCCIVPLQGMFVVTTLSTSGVS